MKLRFFLLFVPVILYSCQSVPKNITYFQDLNQNQQIQMNELAKNQETTIKSNDQLLITISAKNNTNPELTAPFNLPLTSYLKPGEKSIQTSAAVQTYTVNKDGNINYPVIGKIKLEGLTVSEAINSLSEFVSQTVPDPIINIEIISFQVSVLGEVKKPGRIPVPNQRISILDAIAAAEDMTIYGNRENVLLIRETDGKQEFVRFDLTQSEIFSSPYFYLQQNDVLVVDANDAKKRESKHAQADSFKLSTFAAIFSAISTVGMLITAINSFSK